MMAMRHWTYVLAVSWTGEEFIAISPKGMHGFCDAISTIKPQACW
jgi:hypothetical protein